MVTEEQVVETIKKVYDPEIPVNVYDLGLIYNVAIEEESIQIDMTLTSQACPSAQQIPEEIRGRVMSELGVDDVQVNIVWEPTWGPQMISPEGKKLLNLDES